MQNARAELSNLENEIALEIERLSKSSLNELEMARQQVQLLSQGMEELKDAYASRNDARIELSELERQAAAKQQLYVSLFNRLLETEIQVGLQADDARINVHAEAPERPSWPKNKLMLAVLLVASSMVGFGVALLRETFNNLFRTARDVAAFTGREAVAEFPRIRVSNKRKGWLKGRSKSSAVIDHTRFDAGSTFTRSLVKLRGWIEANRGPHQPSSILIASAHDGDGKSMLAVNLAQIEGQRGRRTLLIDCSGAKPESPDGVRLERYPVVYDAENHVNYGDPNVGQPKLICFRYAGADFDRAFCDPATIADETIIRHIGEVAERYDTIFIDTPALMSFAHTTGLIEHCDCSLFVIRAGNTRLDSYRQTFGQFVDSSEKSVGLVLNMDGLEKVVLNTETEDPPGTHPVVTQPDEEDEQPNRSVGT